MRACWLWGAGDVRASHFVTGYGARAARSVAAVVVVGFGNRALGLRAARGSVVLELLMQEQEFERLLLPILSARGLQLYALSWVHERGEQVLRVVVQRDLCQLGEGIGIGDVSVAQLEGVSREYSALLDLSYARELPYRLIVESPGLERELRQRHHFQGAVGEVVSVVQRDGEPKSFRGELVSFRGEVLVFALDDGQRIEVEFSRIKRANTVFTWRRSADKKG